MAPDDTDLGPTPARRATAPGLPRRDPPALEPAPGARRVRALRRSGGRHPVVARAVPRARPRARPAPAARAGAHGRRSSGRRTTAPPSPSPAATARRRSCCTSSPTGRSASTPDCRTTGARSPGSCSTRSVSSAVPTGARCWRRRTANTASTWRGPRGRGPTAASTTAGTSGCASAKAASSRCRRPSTARCTSCPGCSMGMSGVASVLRFVDAGRRTSRAWTTKAVWSVRDVD